MKPTDLPIVSVVVNAGADDRAFDALLLAGPIVIALIALLGETVATRVLGATYVASIIGYVLYLSVTGE